MYRRQFLSLLPAVPLLGQLRRDSLSQAQTGMLTVSGGQLQYQRSGSGRPVIFIDGFASSNQHPRQRPTDQPLPYQTITYQPCNNRCTPSEHDLQELIAALNLQNVVLVSAGNSSTVALNYLKQFGPGQLAGFVFTHVSLQTLQTGPSVLTKHNTPTLLVCNPRDVMLPLQSGTDFPSSLPHVTVTALTSESDPQRSEHQRFSSELTRFISSL